MKKKLVILIGCLGVILGVGFYFFHEVNAGKSVTEITIAVYSKQLIQDEQRRTILEKLPQAIKEDGSKEQIEIFLFANEAYQEQQKMVALVAAKEVEFFIVEKELFHEFVEKEFVKIDGEGVSEEFLEKRNGETLGIQLAAFPALSSYFSDATDWYICSPINTAKAVPTRKLFEQLNQLSVLSD